MIHIAESTTRIGVRSENFAGLWLLHYITLQLDKLLFVEELFYHG